MEDHLQNHYDRSFPGCMKGLAHFLNLQHHLHLRKMKMLTYKKHGEGKRAARNKERKTFPDAPSTSQEFFSGGDRSFAVEDKANDTRKQSTKSSIRISLPKWKSREHNTKKIKVYPPSSSRLLRTSSIHHMSENQADNLNSYLEASIIEQNVEENKAASINEQVYILHSTDDELNFEEQCDDNKTCSKSDDDDELESLLHKVASFAQKDLEAKEMHGDILYPPKEFLDMMNLFNGNIELIRKILEDPSFIFAHYLQGQRAANAQLTRNFSFPALGKLDMCNGGLFRIKHKRFESEFHVKQSGNFPSENSPSDTDIVKDETPKTEIMADGLVVKDETPKTEIMADGLVVKDETPKTEIMADGLVDPSNILQMVRENPSSSSHFTTIKHRIKDIIKDNNDDHHNHISMDGILHKIPYGRDVLKDVKKRKPGQWDVSVVQKLPRESSRNKSSKHADKSINRSQSLNESLHQYTYLYESITRGEFKRLPGMSKFVKSTAKTLGRMLSLSDIKYCSSSKDVRIEDHIWPTSPKNLTTLSIEGNPDKEELKEFTTNSLIREGNNVIPPQEQKLIEEDPICTTWSFALENVSLDFLGNTVSKGSEYDHLKEEGFECNEIFLQRQKSSSDIDCFEAEFNYVRGILKRSGFIGNDILGAWHNPYQPMDPFVFNEAEGLDYEPDIREDEHDILEHQLLFDMINEALVEIYEDSFGYYFPWLAHFSTYIRPVPMGDHILEGVWASIYWHLRGQSRLDKTLDDIVARDFTKNDGWMTIQYDIEDVELEVECLILDDLLDEVVLQLSIPPNLA